MYGNALHKNLCPGGHEIYNFVRPFRGQCNYSLCLNGPCPGVENFLKNTSILHVTPKIPPIRGCVCGRGGHEIYNFWMLQTKFGQDWPRSS